jgi:hypothetical protein
MTAALPPAPASVDYTRGTTDWGMMLNDQLGDCIIADGPGHATQVWTLNATGTMVTPPDSLILETYEKWCGYNPANPATDQGGVELDVLNDWRQQGFNGQTLEAYVSIDLGTRDSGNGTRETGHGARETGNGLRDSGFVPRGSTFERNDSPSLTSNSGLRIPPKEDSASPITSSGMRVPCPLSRDPNAVPPVPNIATAIWLFGGAYIGVELPMTAQSQDIWDVAGGPDAEPGSWGGHAVYLVGYDFPESQIPSPESPAPSPVSRVSCPGTMTCITWGGVKKMTWAWFEKYCSEAYALVSKDWLNASGVSPSGFDLAALEKDLQEVSGARCQVSGEETRC